MKEKEIELLPCPFCGSSASVTEHPPLGHYRWMASCDRQGNHKAHTAARPTQQEAIDLWNTRAANQNAQAVDGLLLELIAKLPRDFHVSEIQHNTSGVYKQFPFALYTDDLITLATATDREARLVDALEQLPREVPTNWCDPLLTGNNAVIKTADSREIEALLLGIQNRLRDFVATALAEHRGEQ